MGKYRQFTGYVSRIQAPLCPQPVPTVVETITVKDLSFAYPDGGREVLRGVSATFTRGQTTAIVGPNGCGKSTLIKLLLRLYDPDSGLIALNGTDIREYDPREYRGRFSVVFQDYKPIDSTIRDNLAPESEGAELDPVIWDALKRSLLSHKVQTLPERLDSPLGKQFYELGTLFSGGEAQRLAIARALFKDGSVLLLDEPMSSADVEAEFQLYETLATLFRDRVVIYVSHRLTSAMKADNILVVGNGAILESGTHEELIALSGRYARLWEIQQENYA